VHGAREVEYSIARKHLSVDDGENIVRMLHKLQILKYHSFICYTCMYCTSVVNFPLLKESD